MENPDALSAATAADRREYLEGGLRDVACQACGTRVLVKKLSPQHTSIQWTTPSDRCPQIASRVASGEHPARIETCRRLRETIDHLISEGLLEVAAPQANGHPGAGGG